MNGIDKTTEYLSFRSSIPQKKICVDDDGKKEWTVYDMGSKEIRSPLICLPPVSARADVFFRQMLSLSSDGYRVISVEYPIYWNWKEFCEGFIKLLDHLHLSRVHVFGASLGGFLAQKFAELYPRRVQSLVLCNAFTDTSIFEQRVTASTFWMLPTVMLKTMVMGNFDSSASSEQDITESIDFITRSLNSLGRKELASRLTLNCQGAKVDTLKLRALPITVIVVNDESALSQSVKDDMLSVYPDARQAQIKSGGNFPYLSRAAEVNNYLKVHLRECNATGYSSSDVVIEETDIDALPDVHQSKETPLKVSHTHAYTMSQTGTEECSQYHKQAVALNSDSMALR